MVSHEALFDSGFYAEDLWAGQMTAWRREKGVWGLEKFKQDLGLAESIRDMAETYGAETGTRFRVKSREIGGS